MDEVTGGWRKVHSEELHNFYPSQNTGPIKSRRMRWAGYVARMGAKRQEVHTLFCRKTRRKGLLERPGHKWEDSIKVDHKEI
jgi:hypothetical protein